MLIPKCLSTIFRDNIAQFVSDELQMLPRQPECQKSWGDHRSFWMSNQRIKKSLQNVRDFFVFLFFRWTNGTWNLTQNKKGKKVVTDDCQAFDFIVTRQKFAYICISPRLFLCCFVNFSLMEKPAETAVVRLPLFLLFEHFQFANRAESTKEEDDEKRMDGAVLVSHSSLPLNPIHFHNAFH